MISRMQLPREMYMGGGISSLPYPSYGYAGGGIADFRPGYGIGGKIKSAFKSVTKPIAKVLDKIVPNEIKPALPFIAAAIPFIGPALGASLAGLTAAQYAAIAPYINMGSSVFSQLSQEGAAERGLSLPSLGLQALSSYAATAGLQDPGVAASKNIVGNISPGVNITGIDDLTQLGYAPSTGYAGAVNAQQLAEMGKGFSNIPGIDDLSQVGVSQLPSGVTLTDPTLAQKFENLGGSTTEFLGKLTRPGMQGIESIVKDPFAASGSDYLKAGQTLAGPLIGASGELAYNAAKDAQKAYQNELLAMGNLAGANKQDQINYIRRAMVSAGFNEDEIVSAISRSGFMYGGNVGEGFAQGGLMNLRMGGMPAEMDLRKGGFVPLGVKEKADDVPARLSKNEFVFTAKAVRNAGGGDVRKGAKRMYQIMNQLEARA